MLDVLSFLEAAKGSLNVTVFKESGTMMPSREHSICWHRTRGFAVKNFNPLRRLKREEMFDCPTIGSLGFNTALSTYVVDKPV